MPRSNQPRRFYLYFALPLACVSASGAALAQTVEDEVMQAVRITGARAQGLPPKTAEADIFRSSDIMDVPSTVNVVTRELLGLQAVSGLYDALGATAGAPRLVKLSVKMDL